MEVKSGEGTVVVADRNRYSDECCNNRVMDRLSARWNINSQLAAVKLRA